MSSWLCPLTVSLALLVCCEGCAEAAEPTRDAGSEAGSQAVGWPDGGDDLPEYSLGRLLVALADLPELVLFDLDTDRTVARFPFVSAARVWSSAGGRYGYALDPVHGALRIVEPGQWLLSHVDHFHVMRGEPTLRNEALAVGALSSLVAHDGWLSVFDASQGGASWFQERSITAMSFAPQQHRRGQPHRGVAAVVRAQLLQSELGVDGRSSLVHRAALEPAEELARHVGCEEPAELGVHEDTVYVACDAGLLRLRFDAGARCFSAQLEAWSAGARPTRVRTGLRLAGALVDVDARSLMVAHDDGASVRLALPSEWLDFAVHRSGRTALVLCADGMLREVSLAGEQGLRTVRVMEPWQGARVNTPSVTISHAYAYVADPRREVIPAVRLRSFVVERELPLAGRPVGLALVGMPALYTDERE